MKNKISRAPGWSTAGKEQRKPKPKANGPTILVTGFWMRTAIDGYLEFLVKYKGKWFRVFGPDSPAPAACDSDNNHDHMIHASGVQNLIDYGCLHPPIKGRKAGKPDRRDNTDRRADKRRTGDKLKAKLAARKR